MNIIFKDAYKEKPVQAAKFNYVYLRVINADNNY